MILIWATLLLVSAQHISCAPLPVEMVDLTHTFNNDTLHYPTMKKFKMMVKLNVTIGDSFWSEVEEYSAGTHIGTHLDAPFEFCKGCWTVDEIPLERLIAPVAVVDITQQAEENRDYLVTVEDLENWERKTEHTLDGMILLLKSGWSSRWGNRESFIGTADDNTSNLHSPGMSQEAAQWLVDNRSIYGLGSETLSLDHGPTSEFPAHRTLFDANIYGLENVANVGDLPAIGATLYVMPMKIGKSTGAPVRIIATFPKVLFHNKDAVSVTERSYL